MRREIAREMKNLAHGLYTVDQESVTADEKETDVRLRSTGSPFEATIERGEGLIVATIDFLGEGEEENLSRNMS